MKAFAYVRAGGAAEAAALVAERPDAAFLGGGTNLVDLMKLGVAAPGLLVDVSRLPYDRVEHRPDGSVLIGAAVRNAPLAGDPGVRQRFPLLAQALLAGASGQLRTSATVAGNLLQRTRCGYFQDVGKPCNKREPGSGCPAIKGAHREAAVLGTSDHCVASHPSDMAVALAALDAVVRVRSVGGAERGVPVGDFLLLPGDTPHRENVLEHGDLVTGVELPAPPAGAVMRYRKVRDRRSFAFALVSVGVSVSLGGDGALEDVRIAFGGIAPKPWRARTAEERLLGRRPDYGDEAGRRRTDALVRDAVAAELAGARPLPGNAFKTGLAADLAAATVRELAGGRPEEEQR